MNSNFEIASGTITGRDHLFAERNNQDALWVAESDRALVAVVADGCGSGARSEVGATLGARLVAEAMSQSLDVDDVRRVVLDDLKAVATLLGGPSPDVMNDYLLFTIVGFAVTGSELITFSLGDGVVVLSSRAGG